MPKHHHLLPLAAAGLLSLSAATPASAASDAMLELFKILRNRGSISEAEYALLEKMAAEESRPSAAPAPAKPLAIDQPALEEIGELEERLAASEARLAKMEQGLVTKPQDHRDGKTGGWLESLKPKSGWFEKLKLDGYTQLRLTTNLNDEAEHLHVPADRSVDDDESLMIRRGRFKIHGDVTDRLSLYSQFDFFGSVGNGGSFGLQARDLYADFAFDLEKEYRVRLGLSKVPFGWVNMQSSQNRGPMERPDALNSAVEGERDTGVYFMYTPTTERDRLKELTASGLKGSGDYGMFTFGAYAGQGLNRSDRNGEVHWLARLTYPWKLKNGQFFETSVNAYYGKFVPTTGGIDTLLGEIEPTVDADGEDDQRIGVSAIWYPQPFGLEAEWNWGRSPELSEDFTRIGTGSLHGGYVQANYLIKTNAGRFFPFVRWNYYDGPRKFATNAPRENVNELDFGLEWSPVPELELSLMYTHTFERTDTSETPTRDVRNADRIGIQVQWNY